MFHCLGRSVPTTTRRVNLEHITGLHLCLANMAQVFHKSIHTHHTVDTHLPRLTARHAERPMDTSVGQNAGRHGLQKSHTPHATIAAVPLTSPARARTNGIAFQSHREGQVAQTAQVLVLKKAMDIQATGALALLQALPLATSGNLGTQVNTMA
jgi:hypothetical protein